MNDRIERLEGRVGEIEGPSVAGALIHLGMEIDRMGERMEQIDARLANLETRIRHFEVIEDRAAREEEQRERDLSRELENERRRQGR